MRTLRKDSENLRDMRIAYTFLLSLAAVCVILGVVSERLGTKLKNNELSDCYRSLALCSDSLSEWELAEGAEERYSAALRFENALATLPGDVWLEPLSSLARQMRGNTADAGTVRAYEETFSLLCALDYADENEAEKTVAETLAAVGDAVGFISADSTELPVSEFPTEVLKYSRKNAKEGIYSIFGKGAGAFEPALSDDRQSWNVETENLRMTFSAGDGSLEGFVYLRVGNGAVVGKGERMSDEERLSAAFEFFDSTVRYRGRAEVVHAGEMCGFLVAEMTADDSLYRAAVDEAGRVWSLMKVKR